MTTAINYLERQARLQAIALSRDLHGVAIVPGANMRYFTGLQFHLNERPTIAFILSGGGTAWILPQLEASKLHGKEAALDVRHTFIWSDADGYIGAFEQAAHILGLRGAALGVDDMTMRVFEWLALSQAAPAVHVAGMGRDLLTLRAIKTQDEIALMRQAVVLSERALSATLETITVGMTERQIADVLSQQLAKFGSHGHAFDPTVLIGANSALPHGTTGEHTLQDGDFLLFDFGGTLNGYPADITRTFIYGTGNAQQAAMHDAVLRANAAGRAAIRPGISAGEVDAITRQVIVEAGFGEYFTHRTGHGLGLEVHELPNIAPNDSMILQAGMVFTIEPGVYLPALGGVRIEDNMVVTETGSESLTTFPREATL